MDGDTTVAYLREVDALKRPPACFSHQSLASPNDVAEPIRFPPWIANLPYDRRMDWLRKDLTDGFISDKSYRVSGLC